jgi:hypothetical protein
MSEQPRVGVGPRQTAIRDELGDGLPTREAGQTTALFGSLAKERPVLLSTVW